jgi:hypothetical protein
MLELSEEETIPEDQLFELHCLFWIFIYNQETDAEFLHHAHFIKVSCELARHERVRLADDRHVGNPDRIRKYMLAYSGPTSLNAFIDVFNNPLVSKTAFHGLLWHMVTIAAWLLNDNAEKAQVLYPAIELLQNTSGPQDLFHINDFPFATRLIRVPWRQEYGFTRASIDGLVLIVGNAQYIMTFDVYSSRDPAINHDVDGYVHPALLLYHVAPNIFVKLIERLATHRAQPWSDSEVQEQVLAMLSPQAQRPTTAKQRATDIARNNTLGVDAVMSRVTRMLNISTSVYRLMQYIQERYAPPAIVHARNRAALDAIFPPPTIPFQASAEARASIANVRASGGRPDPNVGLDLVRDPDLEYPYPDDD